VIASMSVEAFTAALRGQVRAAGGQRVCHRVARAVHAAAAEPGGIAAERGGALERAGFAYGGWMSALAAIAEVEARMVSVLDELHLTCLVTTIPGLSAIGAAAILAETGDPARYDSPRTWVKHAGLAPRANESGTYRGQTKTSGRGRPGLRTAAWRALWGALRNNPAWSARHAYLTTRDRTRLNDGQAAPPSPPRCCASYSPSSPAAFPGTQPWPGPPPAARRCLRPLPDAILMTGRRGEPEDPLGGTRFRAWAPRPPQHPSSDEGCWAEPGCALG
jgi:hypothetical protein